jgi:hypothetical protein
VRPVTERKITPRAIVIAVAIAVLVLGAVGAGIYFLTGGGESPPASESGANGAGAASGAPGPGPTTGTAPGGPAPDAGGADAGAVRAVAEQAVRAINAHDPEALKQISCDPEAIGPAENTPAEARVELVADPEVTGDTATVELKLIIGDQSTTTPLPLRRQDGRWCVD